MEPRQGTILMAFAGTALLAVAAVLFGPGLLDRYLGSAEAKVESVECAEDTCGEHTGGEHAHGADLDMSLEEILAARCEHEMPAHKCAECRYEVGVARVVEDLMQSTSSGNSPLLVVEEIQPVPIEQSIEIIGEVRTNDNRTAHISPRISGVVRSVNVDVGEEVEEDDVLFNIISIELGQALSTYRKSLSLLALSKKNLDREQSLFERKIASEQDLIRARMDHEKQQAELEAAEHKLRVLGLPPAEIADLGTLDTPVPTGQLEVRAPFPGTIIRKHVVLGELAEPGKDVLLLSDLGTVWVWGSIYGEDLAVLLELREEGPLEVDITVSEFPDRTFQGTLDYVGAVMEEKTRTVQVRATLENPGKLLRPGMFCRIHLPVDTGEKVLAIPEEALLSDEGVDFLFKPLEDDYFVRRRVKKGREFDGRVEILEGLEPGEAIVTKGAFVLKSDVLREKMGAGCAD